MLEWLIVTSDPPYAAMRQILHKSTSWTSSHYVATKLIPYIV
jgi:hypothetical protein